jgi:hypothetical protein
MKRKLWISVVVLTASVLGTVPALANVPVDGVVYEGVGVPGIELGFSRAQVEASYGQPLRCQSFGLPGGNALCVFDASNGGSVTVRYRGSDGGFARNVPDDAVTEIRWYESLADWTTTAGINTSVAKTDPDAVLIAYPDAEVTGNPGVDGTVIDWLRGVEVRWTFDGYTGAIHVGMRIFEPLVSLPTMAETRVQDIEISGVKDRGVKRIYAWALILDEYQQAAVSSSVSGEWVLPDGSTQPAYEDFVGLDGTAFIDLVGKFNGRTYRGIYTFRITDVQLADHSFDAADSVTEANVYIR